MKSTFGISREFGLGASSASIGSGPDHLIADAKIGAFRTVLGRHLTHDSLKSLSLLTTFQAEDEGSIPFTRSNLFNELEGGAIGIVSRRAAALCHGESTT
jgi:hypothetical protein